MVNRLNAVISVVLLFIRLSMIFSGIGFLRKELDREVMEMCDVLINFVNLVALMMLFYPRLALTRLTYIDDLELNIAQFVDV